MFYVEWCFENDRFAGKCRVHPLFVYLADSAEEAIAGIQQLVEGLDHDNATTDVDMQYEDTDVAGETTNVCWPPFFEHDD